MWSRELPLYAGSMSEDVSTAPSQTCLTLRRIMLGVGLSATALLGACDTNELTSVAPAADASQVSLAVAGDAALRLDSEGRFKLELPADLDARDEITPERARELASAWRLQFAPMILSSLERDRGAKINLLQLEPCGRVLYSQRVTEPIDESIPLVFRRGYGSWWLVTMCGRQGEPQVSLAVSTRTKDLEVIEGEIVFPPIHGNEFVSLGIPVGHVGEYPAAPEDAVVLAHSRSGQRVTAVPQLLATVPTTGLPQEARWLLPLEKPTLGRLANGADATIVNAYAGRVATRRASLEIAAPSLEQPPTIDIWWETVPEPGELNSEYLARRQTQRTSVMRVPERPVTFERVAAWKGVIKP